MVGKLSRFTQRQTHAPQTFNAEVDVRTKVYFGRIVETETDENET